MNFDPFKSNPRERKSYPGTVYGTSSLPKLRVQPAALKACQPRTDGSKRGLLVGNSTGSKLYFWTYATATATLIVWHYMRVIL